MTAVDVVAGEDGDGTRESGSEQPPPRESFLRRALRGHWVPPLIAQMAGLAFVSLAAGYRFSVWFSPLSWYRWDSHWYQEILLHGYWIHWVGEHIPRNMRGDVGWFPGFPTFARAFFAIPGVSATAAMLVAVWVAWYFMLAGLWWLIGDAPSVAQRWLTLAACCVAPGAVYFTAGFPLSQSIAGTVWCVYFVLKSHSRWAGVMSFLCAAVASYSYLPGVALTPGMIILAALVLGNGQRFRALLAAAGSALGLLAVFTQMQIQAGQWGAYLQFTKKYGIGLNNPLRKIKASLEPIWHYPHASAKPGFYVNAGYQSLLEIILLLTIVAVMIITIIQARPVTTVVGIGWLGGFSRWLAARIDAVDIAVVILAAGTWVIPFIAGGQASFYRSAAYMVLGIPVLRRLPWPVQTLAVLIGGVVLWHMVPFFVNNQMV